MEQMKLVISEWEDKADFDDSFLIYALNYINDKRDDDIFLK